MKRLMALSLALCPMAAAAEDRSPCERLVMVLERGASGAAPVSLDQARNFRLQNNQQACRDALIRVEAESRPSGQAVGSVGAAHTIPLSRLLKMKAFDGRGRQVGEVGRVVIGRDGRPHAVVGVGGFLGLGRKDVAVSLDEAALDARGLVLGELTEEAMLALPSWRQGQGEDLKGDRTAEMRRVR